MAGGGAGRSAPHLRLPCMPPRLPSSQSAAIRWKATTAIRRSKSNWVRSRISQAKPATMLRRGSNKTSRRKHHPRLRQPNLRVTSRRKSRPNPTARSPCRNPARPGAGTGGATALARHRASQAARQCGTDCIVEPADCAGDRAAQGLSGGGARAAGERRRRDNICADEQRHGRGEPRDPLVRLCRAGSGSPRHNQARRAVPAAASGSHGRAARIHANSGVQQCTEVRRSRRFLSPQTHDGVRPERNLERVTVPSLVLSTHFRDRRGEPS